MNLHSQHAKEARRRRRPDLSAWLKICVVSHALFFIGGVRPLIAQQALIARQDVQSRHKLFVDFLKRTAAELSSSSLSGIDSLEAWKHRRPELRRQMLYMLGLDPLPSRTPLQAKITGTLQRPNYRIERLVFQSMPGLYVTGNMYIPREAVNPLPAILYVCGHSPHPKGAKWDYQDRAIWFASNGFAVLVLDTLEFGEVPGLHHGIHDLNLWNWLSLGYTPAGVEVWNAMRALDYLETRREIDPKRIGMTGISGGGSTTWYTAAVDDRVAAAAPVCSTYTFGSQAMHWVAHGQCDCIYFHNTYLQDFPLVGALIAPRPLFMFSGQRDIDFPPDGYHAVFNNAKKIYDLYGAIPPGEPRVRELDGDVGHTDDPAFLQGARQWMQQWLMKEQKPYQALEVQKESADDLAVLERLPADAINYRIHNQFIQLAKPEAWKSKQDWDTRRRTLVRELKDKVFRWFPQDKAPFETRSLSEKGGWADRYANYKEVEFSSEPGVPIRCQLFLPKEGRASAPTLLYVKRPGDTLFAYPLDLDELLSLLGRYNVIVLNPRMTEYAFSSFEYAEIERTASWIGRTVASMQVWDILRTAEWIRRESGLPASPISVYGKGPMGILGLYAGLFDEGIQQVILDDPPASHWSAPALLNVLRITDIPEVAGAFAPRQLVSLTPLPHSFDYARRIYQQHSQGTNFRQAASLPEALEVWKH